MPSVAMLHFIITYWIPPISVRIFANIPRKIATLTYVVTLIPQILTCRGK